MSAAAAHPGAAPVGRLAELPPLERQVIRCLRLWCAGAGRLRTRLRRELAARHGAAAAAGSPPTSAS